MSKSLGNVIDPLHVINGVDLHTLKESVRTGNLAPSEVERYASKVPPAIIAANIDNCHQER
jgi:valyl-tRNA synthetase